MKNLQLWVVQKPPAWHDESVPTELQSLASALARLLHRFRSKVRYYEALARKHHLVTYEEWEAARQPKDKRDTVAC